MTFPVEEGTVVALLNAVSRVSTYIQGINCFVHMAT